jgi:hypothetical protein
MESKTQASNITDSLPYGGDIRAAMLARDTKAVRAINAAKSQNQATTKVTKNKGKGKADTPCCIVCLDSFNQGKRKAIECPECQKSTCRECFCAFLLSSSSGEPQCASCKHIFSLDFLADHTPKAFYNKTYRSKRTEVLLEREKSLLPASQHLVEEYKQREENKEKMCQIDEEIRQLQRQINVLAENRRELFNRINQESTQSGVSKSQFIMGCPKGDCRGFLSSAWKCGTCEGFTCSTCRQPKASRNDEEHKCDPDDVKTAELLSKDTKPCPKCAAPIHKIEGCSQMFCTQCTTVFCWRTGKLETGVIHNPHYYAWQRQHGREPDRQGERYDCGGLPRIYAIERIQRQFLHETGIDLDITNAYRLTNHIQHVVLPRYPNQVGVIDNSDLRVQYLLNNIDEEQWKTALQRRQKSIEKNQEIHHVLQLWVTTVRDIFQRFVRAPTSEIIDELRALQIYANTNLKNISSRYGNLSVPLIAHRHGELYFYKNSLKERKTYKKLWSDN